MSQSIPLSHSSKLVQWFARKFTDDPSSFPGLGKRDYLADFVAAEKYLNTHVHTKTEVLARIADGQGFLTDHGPDHIRMVMHRATELISRSDTQGADFDTALTPYEVFLLLMSIHFHDVGNRYGRSGHETRILEVMAKTPHIKDVVPVSEQRTIARIASTHGGTVRSGKDTIRTVLPEGEQHFGGTKYRPQLLASILRLADELAEDSSRADSFALLEEAEIPEESMIYHKFSQRLDSIGLHPAERKIDLHFSLYKPDIATQFGKHKSDSGEITKQFLLDEILERTRKTFLEALYCNCFLREPLGYSFSTVNVLISPFEDHQSIEPFRSPIRYALRETGYPFEHQPISLVQLCPDLSGISGANLKKELEQLTVAA